MDKLKEADAIVHALGDAIQSGETGLRYVPKLLVRVINEDMWRDRVIKTGDRVTFDRFVDFVTTEPLEGLGADLPVLKRLCCGSAEALDALDRVTEGRQGARNDLVDNINDVTSSPDGTSSVAGLRRLRKDRPDLHEKVPAGEKTTHGAMIEAGFRKKKIAVNLASAQSAAQTLHDHADPAFIAELVTLLLVERGSP